ncbi:MAG: hypothetical protein AB1664_13720 [Thermodesulfobacteriota bacterium]
MFASGPELQAALEGLLLRFLRADSSGARYISSHIKGMAMATAWV